MTLAAGAVAFIVVVAIAQHPVGAADAVSRFMDSFFTFTESLDDGSPDGDRPARR